MMTNRERPLTIADVPATCTLSREGGRCCVSFVAHDPGTWLALFTSLRREFPRHADMTYRGKERGWSLPATHADRLTAWVWLHFAEKRVKGSLAPTAGDNLALLQAERDRAVLELRRMPERGAVHLAIKKRVADLDDAISAEIERMASHD